MRNVSFEFADSTVVVTGGSSGIGRAIALAFGDAGATVINGDLRTQPKGDTAPTTELIDDADGSGTGVFVETDVSDPEQVYALVERAAALGGVDVMVNNAGIFEKSPLRELGPETLSDHLDVNVCGLYYGCQAALDSMVTEGRQGAIVNMASISSDVAQGNLVHYEATKGAVKMITRGTALEAGQYGIRVNAVAPGVIPTELYEGYSEKYQDEGELDELIKPVPLERAGRPEEVAQATLFLASDGAAYVTGETLYVDGGWTAI